MKTGPIPVSTTEATTCPPNCAFNGNGCYAAHGPIRWFWDRVGEKVTDAWDHFLRQVRALPDNMPWRHNQAGDLAGVGEAVDPASLRALALANKGRRGFTYTHKRPIASRGVSERLAAKNAAAIKESNDSGFTVNISANTMSEADKFAALDIGPVVVALPKSQTENCKTPEGRHVIVCPYYKNPLMTCSVCLLCQKRGRKSIVGFPAHGPGWRPVDVIARDEGKNTEAVEACAV